MKRYDLAVNGGPFMNPKNILKSAKEKGLDGIGVLDLNLAQKLKKLNKDNSFEIISAQMLKLGRNYVYCYHTSKNLKSSLIASRNKISKSGVILSFLADDFLSIRNKQLQKYANKNNLAQIAGSNAFIPSQIGEAVTIFEGDLKSAIKKRETKVIGTTINSPFSLVVKLIVKFFTC